MSDGGHVAVIGGGVVGASVGYYLAREGANVLLVDAERPGELTTSVSLAWVNASAKTGHESYFALNFAGCREYERLVRDLPDTGWWNPTGHLRWDYRDERQLVDTVDQLRALGYPAEAHRLRSTARFGESMLPTMQCHRSSSRMARHTRLRRL